MPNISVIINNYNYGELVGRAIESALAHTADTVEVVVVDDGSTDGSVDVLARYRDRVRLIVQENGGQAAAINAGVRESRGEILCFLDADDWWVPQKISAIIEVMKANPRVALAYHRLQPALVDGEPILKPFPRTLCLGDLAPRMARSAGWWPFPLTSALSVRRSAWEVAGPIPTELRISADAWLVGIYPFLGDVAALPAALGFYCLHGRNNWSRQGVDPVMLAKRIAHWQTTIRLTNAFLAGRAGAPTLRLEDHYPLQLAEAQLGGATLGRRLSLALQGLTFGGEPHLLRRVRNTLRDVAALPRPGHGPAASQT